jgi:uncharacterized phage protein (predicted DNA packaging)
VTALATLKAHLNLTLDDDDELLTDKLDAALAYTSHQLGGEDPIEWDSAAPDLRQAVLMLAAHWYENREATLVGVGVLTLPLGYDDLLLAHRRWVF